MAMAMPKSEVQTEGRSSVINLQHEIERLEETVKAMRVNEGARRRTKDKNGTGKEESSMASGIDFAEVASSSCSLPMKEEEKLRRLVRELSSDVEKGDLDIDLITSKMKRVSKLFNEVLVDELRGSLKNFTGNAVETLEPEEFSEKVIIAAMEGEDLKYFSIAEYKKKPEQPKGCSRVVWIDHLKMSKKFADCIAHMCCVHMTGNLNNTDWQTTKAALHSVGQWVHKWISDESMKKEIQRLVPYEIIRRTQDYEYYICLFCNTVHFSVKQFLAHFMCGNHCQKTNETFDMQGPMKLFGCATKFINHLASICVELHGFFTKQNITPFVKGGTKTPQPSIDSIPSVDSLDKIEQKYGKKINGDLDLARLDDPVYVASLLPEIVKNHKSDIGKKLFKELHEYLGTGKTFYCARCRWKVTNRDSFYRHILNPYHAHMNRLEDGRQFNLLTVSINIHMRDDN